MKNKVQTTHCIYCSKLVKIKKGRLESHKRGSVKCQGIGIKVSQMQRINKIICQNSPGCELSKKFYEK